MTTSTFSERFWAKVDTSGDCWVWTASKLKGYGAIDQNGKLRGAHRVSYEMAFGLIPAGMQIDHLCRNPPCVNPAHLEAVTPRENQLRGYGVSGVSARKTECPKGHPYDDANTYTDKVGRRHCRTCSRAVTSRRRGEATYRRDRREAMRQAVRAGRSSREIADTFGVTPERGWQIRQEFGG